MYSVYRDQIHNNCVYFESPVLQSALPMFQNCKLIGIVCTRTMCHSIFLPCAFFSLSLSQCYSLIFAFVCIFFSNISIVSSVCVSSNVNNVKFNILTICIESVTDAMQCLWQFLFLFSLTLTMFQACRENAHFFMYGVTYNR